MKKNTMMRVASFLLVAVLLTTCAISGTFAKYITTDSVDDAARVAYWGFGQTDADIELFKTSYDDTVLSSNTEKVVAPGTSNSVTFGFAYADATNPVIGAPEVDYNLAVTATVNIADAATAQALDANDNFQWSLIVPGGTVEYFDTVAELQAALLKDKDGAAISKNYEAGTLPAGFDAGANLYTIGWKWAFDDTDDKLDGTAAADLDTLDTALGNELDLEDITVTFSITATQID